jgi:hypothetical protein
VNTFIIVDPHTRTINTMRCETFEEAKLAAGLDPYAVDHGALVQGLAYAVYEHALYVKPEAQAYFSIAGILIPGVAVFYGFDMKGETVDLRRSEFPDVRFYLGINDVENAFATGDVERPVVAVNGVVLWQFNKGANP